MLYAGYSPVIEDVPLFFSVHLWSAAVKGIISSRTFVYSQSGGRTYTEVDLERVVDEPLEGLWGTSVSLSVLLGGEQLTVSVPIIKIRTGSPFQRPRKPILP